MSTMINAAALLASFAASVTAHGIVQGIVADGVWYPGYNPNYQYDADPPIVAGWSVPEDLSNGFIEPSNYTNPDIICHLDATPGGRSIPVKAGDVVELQWTVWPATHHGPVMDYLAKCPGSCSTVDKTTLEFFKIDEIGLISDTAANQPGIWGADYLIANNNSWVVTIPASIAPGNYVLRHEILALHAANTLNGAQNYPQCVNLQVSSSGTDNPAGVLGTALYNENDPGVFIDIFQAVPNYTIPGPPLYSGATVISSQYLLSWSSYAPVTSGTPGAIASTPTGGPTTTPTTVSTTSKSSAPPTSTSSTFVTSTKSTTSSTSSSKPATSSTSTSSKSSSSSASSTSSAPSSCATKYGQCGGEYYTGPTCCAAGSTCTEQSIYYSQCL